MTLLDALAVAGLLRLAYDIAKAFARAGDTLDRAPWPAARQTPEPPRLRIVRPGPYDWQHDSEGAA